MKCRKCTKREADVGFKTCGHCREVARVSAAKRRARQDPEIKRAYERAYYRKNRDIIKGRTSAYYYQNLGKCKNTRKRYYAQNKEDWVKRQLNDDIKWLVFTIKQNSLCLRCGFSEDYRAVLFHHRDPKEKLFGLTWRELNNKNWHEVFAELAKCDILCFNCHQIVHKGNWRTGHGF